MDREVSLFDYAKEVVRGILNGTVLTVKGEEKTNAIMIAWGQVGNQWHIPLVTVYIKRSRYSHGLIDEAMNFTLNIPLGDRLDERTHIFGSRSGRDLDKIKESGIPLLQSKTVPSPALDVPSLVLECRVIYRQEQDFSCINDGRPMRSYPESNPKEHQPHTMYQAEVLRAYIHE